MMRVGVWLRPGRPLAVPAARVQPAALAALLICMAGLYLRVLNARMDLTSPSVDENDVVQQAVAFMGGEWRYYLPEYGALPMYLLAGIYHVAARLHGLDGFQYAQRVFFDGAELYFIARLFCAACYALLALGSYRFLAPRFGRSAALLSAALLALPTLDSSTNGTVRIDVMQGAWQMLALFCLVRALESKQLRHWLWAGVAAGLGIASKPMPGLLIAPCFLAASWFATEQEAPAPGRVLLRATRKLAATLLRPGLWAAGLAALAAGCLANPTALRLVEFVRAQRAAASYYSGPKAPGAKYDAFQASLRLGTPFLASAALAVGALVFVRDARARLLALFPLVYVTAFAGRPVRFYYLVAPAMALCVVIGVAFGLLMCRAGLDAPGEPAERAPGVRRWLAPLAAACLVPLLAYVPVERMDQIRRVVSDATRMRAWINEHVPSRSQIFYYGKYQGGPRLVVGSLARQRALSDFFDYGREHYAYYERAFREAYANYVSAGRPVYALEVHAASPEPAARIQRGRWLSTSLDRRAARAGQDYILLSGFGGDSADVNALGYEWIPRVELAQQFGRYALFRVPRPAASPEQAAAPGAGAATASSQRAGP